VRHLILFHGRINVKLKRMVTRLVASILVFAFSSTTAFAGLNLGNDDGTNFKGGTSNNYWGVYTDGGVPLNDTEGLRVTIYDAKTNVKVFNTIDITGNANISAASAMQYFSDGNELISKTTWLNYVSSTYNSVSETDMAKFNSTVMSRASSGGGYKSQYIPELASVDIVSVNNTSNLDAIKSILGDKNFLTDLCNLIGGGLKYADISQGKYKIAFEPVAYFRYNGQNWAMSATECGLLNKYMKNYFTAGWNSTNNLRALLGPLTHSNLPRSAFLENKDLGISVYSPSSGDYYNGNSSYNSDTCIIRCMGIGVLSAEEPPDDDIGEESTSSAEYHTDTDVYTSFYAINVGDVPFIGESSFSIYDSGGETPRKYEQLKEENKKLIHATGSQSGVTYYYAYTSTELETVYADDDEKIDVFIDNPAYVPDEDGEMPYVSPYVRLGSFKHGDEMRLSNTFKGTVSYKIKTTSGSTIKSGTVNITCPAGGEEAMGWIKWHTPRREQSVVITLESKRDTLILLDENGDQCEKLIINADIAKVKESTPPDPQVSDTRPSWQKIYSQSSVQDRISEYVSNNSLQELSWYTWSIGASWTQHWDWTDKRVSVITGGMTDPSSDTPYWDAETKTEDITFTSWGVDNHYFASATAERMSGKFYTGAVLISKADLQLEKVTYSVSMSAEATISPSDYCKTATYSESNGKYTMKSGYGIQINVDTHLSGDTQYCTGSQTANVLFPEFNYNRHNTTLYNRLLEKVNGSFVFKKNKYSTYNDRVHFTPIWFPDKKNYTVYVEVFDVWCPAGQLSVRLTDQIYINGNVYDDWHIAPVKP
jgi:hypothetical protein